jgi:hypothetical protein
MALVSLNGGAWQPSPNTGSVNISSDKTSLVIDATGEMIAYSGRIKWAGGSWGDTKDISRCQFLFGTVTKAGGSALTVSLQDVSATTGPVMQPDGTQDQTVAIANGDASFASDTWYRTGALSANRTVTYGDLISFVVEFDGSGRLGADSVSLACLLGFADFGQQCVAALKTGGSYAIKTGFTPNVIFEFSDGEFGTLDGGFPYAGMATRTFNLNTATADEYALQFTVPGPCKIDDVWAIVGGSATYEINLYAGSTLQTNFPVTIDNNQQASNSDRLLMCLIPQTTLASGTTYRVSIRPTTTTNVNLRAFTMDNAAHFSCHPGGTTWIQATQLNQGGTWTTTDTARPFMGVKISHIDDGASAGGGGGPLIGGRLIG